MKSLRCYNCNSKFEFHDNLGFKEECGSCREDLHVCRNCHFYDPGSYNECKETSADVVKDKERANFCEYFVASDRSGGEDKSSSIKSAAEALFKKK
ncbi:MAG: hypothetical protein AB8E15_02095 [Bdellovibrionales bacterium]